MTAWKPKPRNWRRFYGHRPVHSLTWKHDDAWRKRVPGEYIGWLAKARGWTHAEANAYVDQHHKPCGLIAANYSAPADVPLPLGAAA
jgi:hypothetical protein